MIDLLKWLKYKSRDENKTLDKPRLLINFIVITALFAVFYVLISVCIEYAPGRNAMTINFFLFLINLWFFVKRKLSYLSSAHFYIFNCTVVAITSCTFYSGGLFSPVYPWFILIPTISVLLLGINKHSRVWLFATLGIIASYLFLLLMGVEAPICYNPKFKTFFFFTCIFGLALIVYLITTVFEKAKEKAISQLAEKNKEIVDSIYYAKRIQNTILAPKEFLANNFPFSFVFYKPKDIVSGDFYWAEQKGDNTYLVVGDCTGHGVPGAFMSLLTSTYLGEAINEMGLVQPNEIFDFVRTKIVESISKDGVKDGMEGSIFRFQKGSNVITYSSANSSQILIRKGAIFKLQKDKMSVGVGDRKQGFSLFTIHPEEGDTLYCYTDGFSDLFGGPKGKKFSSKRLNNFLLSIHQEEIKYQRDLVKKCFNEWKGELEQVDDVCMFGLRLNGNCGI